MGDQHDTVSGAPQQQEQQRMQMQTAQHLRFNWDMRSGCLLPSVGRFPALD